MDGGKGAGLAPIFPNFTNYLHAVPQPSGSPEQFLLFNPSIHFWIALNATGARIVRAMDGGISLDGLRDRLAREDGVDDAAFEAAVRPFVDRLVALHFFGVQRTAPQRSWVPEDFSLDRVEDYPFNEIIVSLGDRCNLECGYCFNQDTRGARLKLGSAVKRLGREDIRRILVEFWEMGGRAVLLTGGEPTLNPQFLDICEDARGLGFEVKVITNGTRLATLDPARLAESVSALAVSLDSLDDAVNARLWGVAKYQARRDILAPLARIGRLSNSRGERVRIVIKPTVTRRNLGGLQGLMSEVGEFLDGCDFGFDVSAYEDIGHAETDTDLLLGDNDLESELERTARSIIARKSCFVPDRSSEIEAEAFGLSCGGKLDGLDKPTILSCAPSLFVTNIGDVYPCQALELPEFRLGNVFADSLRSSFARDGGFATLRRAMTRDDAEICRDCEFRFVCTEHCHGCSYKKGCRTTAFLKPDDMACRKKIIRRLWLETQRRVEGAA